MAWIPIQSGPVASAADRTAPNTNGAPTTPPQLQPLAAIQYLPQHDRAELSLRLLQEAWICRDFRTIQALLEAKAVSPNSFICDFEIPEGGYLPILAHACRRGHTELVSCLLEHGAQPAFWMLAEAFEAGHDDVVQLMAKHADIDMLRDGISLLHDACRRLDVSAVDRLIRLDADVNKRADTGAGPLVLVFRLGADPDRQVAVMTSLLDAGADIETRFQHLTPLALACRHNCLGALSLLLKRGADPNADLGRGVRPLSLCCGPEVTPDIFAKLVEGGGRIPLDDALWLIGDGADLESVRKRNCITVACTVYDRRPVIEHYFRS